MACLYEDDMAVGTVPNPIFSLGFTFVFANADVHDPTFHTASEGKDHSRGGGSVAQRSRRASIGVN